MPIIDSPLRYPGGKTQLKDFINEIIEYNSIKDCTYVEPFAGGAGVALSLLFSGKVSNIIINDLDPSIFYFWYSVLNHTEEFINLINTTPVNLEQWYIQKKIYNNIEQYTPLEIGFAFFFLNRTNISGIISGGPIGGMEQNSKDKIDCRFNKKDLIKKIWKISSYRENITLFNYDASIFIDTIIKTLDKEKTFIFFDPPYYQQGKKLYTNFFSHEDHVNLKSKIKTLRGFYWITTYDYVSEIEEIYNTRRTKIYSLKYSANRKRNAKELLFYSNRLKLPNSRKVKFIRKTKKLKFN